MHVNWERRTRTSIGTPIRLYRSDLHSINSIPHFCTANKALSTNSSGEYRSRIGFCDFVCSLVARIYKCDDVGWLSSCEVIVELLEFESVLSMVAVWENFEEQVPEQSRTKAEGAATQAVTTAGPVALFRLDRSICFRLKLQSYISYTTCAQ